LGLQVPVEDVLAVEHAQACRDLREEAPRPLLRDAAALAQELREVTAGAVLQHEVEVRGTFLQVTEAHNVLVGDAPQHLNLLT